MKVLIAPDSFKGSLSAQEATNAIEEGIRRAIPYGLIKKLPMADGGEGTLDAILHACGGMRNPLTVTGADFLPTEAEYAVTKNEQGVMAVIEIAKVVGLTLMPTRPVMERSSYGVGELVRCCLDQGIRRFMIGLGGSSTNDGGIGMLAALGVGFIDANGANISPTPSGLMQLSEVDFSGLDIRLKESEITLLSDVRNTLCGTRGATAVYGSQKGVKPEELEELDRRIGTWASMGDEWFGSKVSQQEGAGAAGGLGYGFRLLGARYCSGAEMLCTLFQMDAVMSDMDWVVTGEGRSDLQTLEGKVPWVIARHGKQVGVPVTLISGSIDPASVSSLSEEFSGCYSIMKDGMAVTYAMENAASLLADAAECAARQRL